MEKTTPIIGFIGWHNSGKTTLAAKVVQHLKQRGYAVAVIKSTKETGIPFNPPGTDTHTYLQAGADDVTLIAPDQTASFSPPTRIDLPTMVNSRFAHMDLVVVEGFKHHPDIPKIEVAAAVDDLLFQSVPGVIAVAADIPVQHPTVFSRDQIAHIADFIIKRLEISKK